jgi:hypothetical protein
MFQMTLKTKNLQTKNFIKVAFGLFVFALVAVVFLFGDFKVAQADVTILRPDGDGTVNWSTSGSTDDSCPGGSHCDFVVIRVALIQQPRFQSGFMPRLLMSAEKILG